MVVAKYSFGSWGNPRADRAKAPAPSGPSGIPLTFYAGYECIQFANPSDPQTTSFRDDGFLFNATNAAGSVLSANGTTIANNAFNAAVRIGHWLHRPGSADHVDRRQYGITRDLDLIGAYYHYIQNHVRRVGSIASGSVAACNSAGMRNAPAFLTHTRRSSTGGSCRSGMPISAPCTRQRLAASPTAIFPATTLPPPQAFASASKMPRREFAKSLVGNRRRLSFDSPRR